MISIAALIEPGDPHRDDDIDQLEAEEPLRLAGRRA